jgi:hypothetical protein
VPPCTYSNSKTGKELQVFPVPIKGPLSTAIDGGPVTGCVLVLRGGDSLGEADEVAAGVPDGEFFHAVEGGSN